MIWSMYDEAYDKGLAKIRCIYCSLAQSRNIPETIYELCLNVLVLIMLRVVERTKDCMQHSGSAQTLNTLMKHIQNHS